MWSQIIDSVNTLLPQVYDFFSGIPRMFNRSLSDIAQSSGGLGSFFLNLLPDKLMNETLLSVMVGAIVPVALVIYVVKVFVDW